MTATVQLAPLAKQRFTDNNGNPAVGGKLFTYAAGTTAKQNTYTDSSAATPNQNPVLLDARGEAAVWIDQTLSYKFTLAPATDTDPPSNPYWTIDSIKAFPNLNSVDAAGAFGNGTADDSGVINALTLALSAGGGGVIDFGAGKTYAFAHPLVQKPNVKWRLNGATLVYTGSGDFAAVTSDTTTILTNAGIENGTINVGAQAVTVALLLNSPYHCAYRDLVISSNSATVIALDIEVNTAGGTNADGNRNAVFNVFQNILQDGVCGTALRLKGNATGVVVVTLNSFLNFNARGCSVYGIAFDSWCDSNYFAGVTRIQLVANNAQGVVWNSGTPASNVGVYSNNFDHLAIDTFGSLTGRVALVMNWTKLNKIDYFFNDPPAEGGAYSISANTQSYYIAHQVGLTSNIIARQKLFYDTGHDNPTLIVGGGAEITTDTVAVEVGLGRTGSGIAYIDLIGDTTYTAGGLRMIRNGGGANTSSALQHRGTGNFQLQCLEAGGQIILQHNAGLRLVTSDVGIGFNGAAAVAQSTGWGSPTGGGAIANFAGSAATLAQTGQALAQLLIYLKSRGDIGA